MRLADTVADPVDLLGRRFEEPAEAVVAAPEWPDRSALLDAAPARWMRSSRPGRPPAGQLPSAWDLLVRTGGRIAVRDLAAATDSFRLRGHCGC
ncbi:hypothetical protein ACWC0C_29215 [Streptomyces sp. NPDC001709]